MLLQSILIGKAHEVYSALSIEQSEDYEVVKREILKAYELVPKAYRWIKCKEEQTYMEFARQKDQSMSSNIETKSVTMSKYCKCFITSCG